MSSLSSRLEQEIHERNLSQSELKMQNQQVAVMRSSEKGLKQEINHLLDTKDDLESQNQELRRFKQTSLMIFGRENKQSSIQKRQMGWRECCLAALWGR